ncbi:type IV secretion system DNA-binding domain-containing protein [Patescibacteria group bacterium]|nr:type IV secretion system DNA-binding domain-containing protein [Patescibacteria group bacterium]MBU1501133.1 type IV secretion system DNA-binding domain-containing protein [Patescibacteria group bacterium]MBU2080994.1 type IV secretion system DNA-binding domain-containing protein [Patescibacteria group bacterium]MBU2124086.1 type IV secretion system DNA-binding domain-containing protein [Patescibacteria group bacterium]MBU2194941.1 type IV secretion system DNA-binding domain-containing prote
MENPERVTYFAATDSRGKRVPFGIKAKDRARHMYVIGKTGMGKSTLLENMAIQDIRNGEGMAFIDPHGSAVEKLLDFIPENRIKDVVYFAPFDLEQPMAFNVMEDVGYDKRHLVVSGLMATFKKIWEDAWSARMEYILTNTLLALLEYPDATLLGVNRMYTDKGYRKKVVDNVKDPVVKDFWTKEFANYGDRYTQEATPAIQNKIGQFTGNPLIRNIIGQPDSSFDIRTLMDERKILLINLSKGLVGDTNMQLLGSMLTTRIFLAAMSRANLPAHELARAPNFYFYVDEFQNFANQTFSEILSEARKYHLNLLLAHQYVAQMEEEVQAAVFGNVGTTVAFRVGPLDAELLEKVFTPEFLQEDLVNLGFAQVYLSLMIDGIGSRPFSGITIPPIEAPQNSYRKEVIEHSRTVFGTKRALIEERVQTEYTEVHEQGPKEEPKPKTQNSPKAPQKSPDRPVQKQKPRPEPAGKAKTASDLKEILRATIAAAEKDTEKKQHSKKEVLQNTLKEVAAQTPPQKQKPQNPSPAQSVFEVPEETLRSIFKDV